MRHVLRVAVMVVLACVLCQCARTAAPPTPETDRTKEALHKVFPVVLKAGVTLETRKLLAWHPDVVPYLKQWVEALCQVVVTSTDTQGLQVVMLGTLDRLDMPAEMRQILADFVPVIAYLIPVALAAAEVAIPEGGQVLVVVTDICKWILLAMPPTLAAPVGSTSGG